MLDDHLLRRFGHWGSSDLLLHLLLMVQSGLLLGLVLQFNLLFLAWFVAVFVTTRVLPLVPAPAANARPAHNTNWHFDVAAILLVDCFHFFKALNFQIKSMYLLHQLALSSSLIKIRTHMNQTVRSHYSSAMNILTDCTVTHFR